jgi:hypothetical protein
MNERKIPVPLLFSRKFYYMVLNRREKARYKTLSTFIEDELLSKFEMDDQEVKEG